MEGRVRIRRAERADIDTLIAFTVDEAREAEGLEADPAVIRRGVEGAFDDPRRASYWVVESAPGTIIASASINTEWSDFHGGEYWWIQSIFITPPHRSTGLLRQLLDHLRHEADAAGALDVRLYVHTSNERAIRAYRRYGFRDAPYAIMSLRAAAAAPQNELRHVTLVVRDYDEAIAYFTGVLGFRRVEDRYIPEQDKRWVLVAPSSSRGTSVLLARPSRPGQQHFIGNQTGGRVTFFLGTDDFWRDFNAFTARGVEFVRPPSEEPYGIVDVFKDLYGNLWDLIQHK